MVVFTSILNLSLLHPTPPALCCSLPTSGLKVFIINAPNIDFDVNTLQAEAGLGFICGAIAALLTTPPDVITTRIITQGDDAENPVGFLGMGQRWVTFCLCVSLLHRYYVTIQPHP